MKGLNLMLEELIIFLNTSTPLIFCITGIIFGEFCAAGHIRHQEIKHPQPTGFGVLGFLFFVVGMMMLLPPRIGSSFIETMKNLQNTSIIAVFAAVAIVFGYVAIAGGIGHRGPSLKSFVFSLSTSMIFTFLIVFIQLVAPAAFTKSETLHIPFTLGTRGVQTQQSYEGIITIEISGTGQAERTEMSDAFYIYTDASGKMIQPWHPKTFENFTLWINGEPADYSISIPIFRLDHTYSFPINAQGSKLTFAVGDKFTKDNSGSYTITILSY